jgi:regulator of cell morphogenesis and NO signaling
MKNAAVTKVAVPWPGILYRYRWRVNMPTATQSIREIVTAEPSAAAVFERFEIDLCSRADAQLERACAELQLSVDQVLEKLADAESRASGAISPDVASYSLTRLIQHIVRTHHQTARQELPHLAEVSQKIAGKHGEKAPQYKIVAALVEQLRAEMLAHLEKEEQVLFPYVVRLEEAAEDRSAPPHACFGSVAQPVSVMVQEHNSAERIVAELRELTNGFKAPRWACPRNSAFHAGLRAFDEDLRQHVHLENDLLFPRAIALEAELRQRR